MRDPLITPTISSTGALLMSPKQQLEYREEIRKEKRKERMEKSRLSKRVHSKLRPIDPRKIVSFIVLIALLTSLSGYSQVIDDTAGHRFEEIIEVNSVVQGCLVYNCPEHSPKAEYVSESWVNEDTVNIGDLYCRHSYLTEESGGFVTSDTIVYNYYRAAICRKCLMYVIQSKTNEFDRLKAQIKDK